MNTISKLSKRSAKFCIVAILTLDLAAAHAQDYGSQDGGTENEPKGECMNWIYSGKHSRLGFGKGKMCWRLPKGALKIEDTSWKKPFGGPNSLPNETKEKLHDKPKRWLNKRLGTKW